jgi:hypothetical protein
MERDPDPTAGAATPAPARAAYRSWLAAPAIAVLLGLSIMSGLPSQIARTVLTPVAAVYEHLVCGMQHAVNDIADTGSSCH